MGYSFDIELDSVVEPFVVDLEVQEYHTQTIKGALVIKLDRPETFKVATVSVYGHLAAMMNIDTPQQAIIREALVESSEDLIAANDREGHGTIKFEAGTQYLPFRIDLHRSGDLPPTLINKLDTPFIDWKYEIHATLRRDYMFSSTRLVKHDLILRRPLSPLTTANTQTTSTDMPGQFRSKVIAPSRITLGQETLLVSTEMKARSKAYMIKEIDCAIVQTEDINYLTRRGHPSVDNAHVPGAPCQVKASRVVSSVRKHQNEDNDMDYGRHKPILLELKIDNFQLIPTENRLGWLDITHVLRYTVHFMDVNLTPIITELPLFVGQEVLSKQHKPMKFKRTDSIIGHALKIEGEEYHRIVSERDSSPELEA